ncbi:MAG: hypothetical protein K1566_10855 [Candidatus Thiodiazotropha sp. (ex. Lucinisca nassula)]|nr:hypothetical protein [Candidatus Thiodiazotropha sp. (ex. Lucinisca nassula)]
MFLILCLMVLSIPFAKGPIEYEIGIITLHIYQTIVLIMFPLVIWRIIKRPSKYGFRNIEIFLLLLTLSYLQSTLLSSTLISSGRLAFHALFIPVLSYIIVKSLVRTEKEYKIINNIIILSVLIFAVSTIVSYFQTGIRPIVFDIEPIGIATITIVGLFLSLFYNSRYKIINYIKTIIIGIALLLSMSRVYLLYVLVSPISMYFIKKNILLLWIAMFVGSLAITMTVTYSIDDYSMANTSAEGANTLERMYEQKHFVRALAGRAYVYKTALGDFWNNLVFGIGIRAGDLQITPHNFHVEWLQYGGVVGYILYTMVFLAHVTNTRIYIKNDKYLIANQVALLAIMINSITNGFMHGVIPYMAFIVIGLSEARINILRQKKIINNKS